MSYYLIWVRSNAYHGNEPLTYSGPANLKTGQIVRVGLNNQLVNGFISASVAKPSFTTKPIETAYDLPPLPKHSLALITWLKDYYPAPIGLLTQQVLPAGDLSLKVDQIKPGLPKTANLAKLTDQQKTANQQIKSSGSYLLHGITGSGKTRVYIEQALHKFMQGLSSIILTPEISLTKQLGDSFKQVFGDQVIVMHSKQTPKERLSAWLKCLTAAGPVIVVGPRSSLFAPLKAIGLIVLDEAHETAYKQTSSPQYVTSRVAAQLKDLTRAVLILGSATPLVSDYELALKLGRPILKLTKLARQSDQPKSVIKLIDRRNRDLFTKSLYFSDDLTMAIKKTLSDGSQVLLYLNRRGTARLILCPNCGWQALCPNCHTPLTYHGDKHYLRCHACGFYEAAPTSCPNCGYPDIVYQTAGTKAIADEAAKLFPGAKIARFDSDNIKSESFEIHYDKVKAGQVDIIIGTQLIAKGLDLPYLGLVGIILADTSLYLPDYTATERTFQLINQVIGRIGRGHRGGQAIVQTYQPDHPSIKSALLSNYDEFYEAEIVERQHYDFPPYCFLLKLVVKRATAASSEAAASTLKRTLEDNYRVKVLGPAPSFYEYRGGKHHWQLIVKTKDRPILTTIMSRLPSGWSADIDPVDLL